MNQLELLSSIKKQQVRDSIVNTYAIYLGDIYVYFNKMYITIRSNDPNDGMVLSCILPIEEPVTKDVILKHIPGMQHIIGSDKIYLDGLSLMNDTTMRIFESIRILFLVMGGEYEEFIEDINIHLDEIILSGGRYG